MVLGCGVHTDIPAEDYHKLPYIGSTQIKAFADNPRKSLTPIVETPDMQVGSAIHVYCLEGEETFHSRYAVEPEWGLNKNSNAYKEKSSAFEDECRSLNKIILPASYKKTPLLTMLRGVKDSLHEHPFAKNLFKEGNEELTLIWDDQDSGERCKARLDWFPSKLTIVDLKKTADVLRFKYQMRDLHYSLQGGHYSNGANACGMPVDTFMFVYVEAEHPYPVGVGYINPPALEYYQHEARRYIKLISQCKKLNIWPNYKLPEGCSDIQGIAPRELLEVWE